jgi:NADH:ubiquinone oxidoreductase subunit C
MSDFSKLEAHPQPVKPYPTFKVAPAKWFDTARSLKEQGFGYLDMVTSIDWKGPVNVEGYVKDPNPNPFLPEGATPETDAPTATPGVAYRDAFEVVALFSNLDTKEKVALKAELPRSAAKIASLIPLYKTADWQEREVYDLMGIAFEGHPNLTKILTPEFTAGHPLRKDYVHVKDKYD